jgi:hypothetical protein
MLGLLVAEWPLFQFPRSSEIVEIHVNLALSNALASLFYDLNQSLTYSFVILQKIELTHLKKFTLNSVFYGSLAPQKVTLQKRFPEI